MGRKNTIHCARHIIEDKEIKRIIEHYRKSLKIDITILEASAILAERSQSLFWNNKQAKEIIMKLRGIL